MRKFLLLLSLMCLGLITAYSQSSESTTKVKLKNGHTISGKLVSYIPDSLVILEINGQELTIQMDNISEFKSTSNIPGVYRFSVKKWWHYVSAAMLHSEANMGFAGQYTLFYNQNHWANIGAGLGFYNYRQESRFNLYPIHLEWRAYLMKRKRSPYISVLIGHALAFEDETSGQTMAKGGAMYAGKLGIRFGDEGVVFDFYTGIRSQKSEYKYSSFDISYHDVINYRRLEFGLGIMF